MKEVEDRLLVGLLVYVPAMAIMICACHVRPFRALLLALIAAIVLSILGVAGTMIVRSAAA